MSGNPNRGDVSQELLEHARRVNEGIARRSSQQRTLYCALASLAVLAGVALLIVGQYVFGICGIGLAVAFGLRLLDAHGHLQEVRRRSVGTLVPRISRFLRPAASETSSEAARRHPE